MNKNRWLRKISIVGFWLIIWQLISIAVDNSIIIVGPVTMLQALLTQISTADFWITIGHTFGKISLGFLTAFFLGILTGSMAYGFFWFQELLEPIVLLMKSIPVASFVILALIWAGSSHLSVLISFLMVFPVIYINTIAGLQSTDTKLLEMAQVFRIPVWKRIHYIYCPALIPYLISGCKSALGMSWKSGIAAEVIGVPEFSIGEKLYMSKIYLDTADLFAWTFVIILISIIFEKTFLLILKQFHKEQLS